jgi:hypothetical protein
VSNQIEALQEIVNDESLSAEQRKAAAEHILQLQGEPMPEPTAQIADNDPGLIAFGFENGKRIEKDEFDRLYNKLNPLSLSEAKAALARRRAAEKLIAVAKDATRPTGERLAALSDIFNRGLPWPHWMCGIPAAEVRGLTIERILDRLTPSFQAAPVSEIQTNSASESTEPLTATKVAANTGPTFTSDDFFNYQAWKLTRDGQPAGVADWMKERKDTLIKQPS